MAEIICEVCGAEISKGSLACPVCGAPAPAGVPQEQNTGENNAAATGLEQSGYVDLAEVTVPGAQEVPPQEIPQEPPAAPEAPVAPETLPPEVSPFDEEYQEIISSVADESVAPGVVIPPETVELTDAYTGGYQEEQQAGPSVAGAGAQTADDPFGLEVNENPPIPMVITEEEGRFSWDKIKNIIIMVGSVVFAIAVATVGIYFLVTRKPAAPKADSPEIVLDKALTEIFTGNMTNIEKYAVPDSDFINKANQVFEPYREIGTLAIKELETETNTKGDQATLTIITLNVDISTPDLNDVIDALTITKPVRLPTVVFMEKRDGKWIIVK